MSHKTDIFKQDGLWHWRHIAPKHGVHSPTGFLTKREAEADAKKRPPHPHVDDLKGTMVDA